MPTLSRLCRNGFSGPLRSTDPPVTIPAWVTMTSGRDPGELGIYGFRNRRVGSYGMDIVSSDDVKHPRIWDLVSDAGQKSVVVSVPLTYPVRTGPGVTMAGCFLTPGATSEWLSPSTKRGELERLFGPYLVDVPNYRAQKKEEVLAGCHALTKQHFGIFRNLVRDQSPAFAMIVDLGPDRLHHALLGSILPEHPLYESDGPLVDKCRDYYAMLDGEVARTLELADNETTVLIVSDHGVQPLEGAVAVNEWLMDEGYLVVDTPPDAPTPLSRCAVDWSRTRAWGEGGHHCRICFNVKGREAAGIIEPSDLESQRDELLLKIQRLKGPGGEHFNNKVIIPGQRYPKARGLPPDLIVYWDDLKRRAVGTMGHGQVHLSGNDTGHDEANHAQDGIFITNRPSEIVATDISKLDISDVFNTAVGILGL
jgi:predicted AlkP superfamily phosphohydrolase/phosphomutase